MLVREYPNAHCVMYTPCAAHINAHHKPTEADAGINVNHVGFTCATTNAQTKIELIIIVYFGERDRTTAGASRHPAVYTKYKVARALAPRLSCAFRLLSRFCIALNGAKEKKNETVSSSMDVKYPSIRQVIEELGASRASFRPDPSKRSRSFSDFAMIPKKVTPANVPRNVSFFTVSFAFSLFLSKSLNGDYSSDCSVAYRFL